MKQIIPGHSYQIDYLRPHGGTKENAASIIFVSKVGDKFPGNEKEFDGTNCQELLRVLIDRVKYLQRQTFCIENLFILFFLRLCICFFEFRASRQKNRFRFFFPSNIELRLISKKDGHIQ